LPLDRDEVHVEKIAKWSAVIGVGNNYKITYPVSVYWHSLQNNFDGATTIMGIRLMISDTGYKYPLQVLYLYLTKCIVAVNYDTAINIHFMSVSCSTSYFAIVRDPVLIL
jgi:hypothetical protein